VAIHSTTAALRSSFETAQNWRRCGKVRSLGQLPAAEPDRRGPGVIPQCDRVADDLMLSPGLEAGPNQGPAAPQAPDELGFVLEATDASVPVGPG